MTETTFTDDSGDVRFSGKIRMGGTAGQVATVQSNGTLAPAPGGGGSPPLANTYYGSGVSIGNGLSVPLTANFPSAQGAALLDLTTPSAPKLIAAGVYVIAAEVLPSDAMTAGGSYYAQVDFPDSTLTDLLPSGRGEVQVAAADPSPPVTVTMPYLAAAGDSFVVSVTNLDGVQTIHFALSNLSVVKFA